MGFVMSYGCMMGNIGQSQANQSVVGISTATIQVICVIDEIDSFRGATLIHKLFELA